MGKASTPRSGRHGSQVGQKRPSPSEILTIVKSSRQRHRAADRIRTDDNHVGNVMLCQLSYSRK